MKLYEIVDEYAEVLKNLENSESFDFETIDNTLTPIKKSIEEKSKNVAAFISNMEIDLLSLEEHNKNIISRIKKQKNRIDGLRNYLKINMEKTGINSIKCSEFTITLKKCQPTLIIDDELSLPSKYIKSIIKTEIDKSSIKNDLKNGEIIGGCYLKDGNSLTIKLD